MKTALTIAGSDPSGGAGLQADLKVFHALGVYGLSVVTAITAQNSFGVTAVRGVESTFVSRQMDSILADFLPQATKIGMVFSSSNAAVTARFIRNHSLRNVVLDPLMKSSSGSALATGNCIRTMKKHLLPLCTVVTPNIQEASVLTGMDISSVSQMEQAARCIRDMGPSTVVITGGHLPEEAVDVIYDGRFRHIRSVRLPGEFHGTGCVFSAALAAFLARGASTAEGVSRAKKFTSRAIRGAVSAGGPLRLLSL